MPKRFTDTGIWVDKPWFIDLTPAEKCAWFFLKDRCDSAGVWRPNFKIAELVIGAPIDWDSFFAKCNHNKTRIEVLPDGKWWLTEFVEYQYGELRATCKPHQAYITLLKKHGLYERVKGIDRVPNTLQEKEKEKELEREKEKDPDPRVRALTKYYADKYEARTKTKAYISWGHWGRCLKQLLRVHTEDTVRKVIDEFFGYDKRTRFAFKDFFATFNNLLPRVNGVRAGPVTTGTYVWGKCPDCGKPITNTAGMCVCGYGR